jgi:eukaryotic-like serine/threonine-protein kinase
MADSGRRRLTPADLYRRAWASGPAPDLAKFVATLPALNPDELLDLIEVDRAERWRRGDRWSAERYLKMFPTLKADPEASLVVIYGEFYLRKELGEVPSLLEYVARFPAHADRLRDQVMWHEAIDLSPVPPGPPEIPGLDIADRLGRGGMCTVYRATDGQTGAEVAVKVLDRDHRQHPVRVARFAREVGSLTRLAHPHIVHGLRTGEAGGLPYLVMEFCPGGTLAAYLGGKARPPADAAAVIIALAGAVEYAHREGVVHRDLKPSNILLGRPDKSNGRAYRLPNSEFVPKVADFGLAKVAAELGGSLTATREALGTPCYMAPELATGARDADARTDVYGLGAIFYELLTGRPPFTGPTPLDVVRMVREDAPTPPTDVNRAVPPTLNAVCLRCLEKDPKRRYATAIALADAIHTAL